MKYSLPLKSGSYCSVVYKALAIGGAAYLAVPAAHAQQMTVSFDIPRMKVAEYHRPYIAIWIEDEKGKAVTTLRVLYDVDLKADDGRKWLADMRAWWRKAGRNTKNASRWCQRSYTSTRKAPRFIHCQQASPRAARSG